MDGSGELLGNVVAQHAHPVHSTAQSNALAERFLRSIKTECLDKMIFVGERSLRRALTEFRAHYQRERPHQGLGNEIVGRVEVVRDGDVMATERLGGLLKFYDRQAA